jgi:amino acid adenylation domain-containing protein
MSNWIIEQLNDNACINGDLLSVVSKGQKFTYRKMMNPILGLAEELQALGIKKGDVCAVLCDRNAYSIISILSIWAVGGSYLPINQENPALRNDYVISNSNTKVIVDATSNCMCTTCFSATYSSLIIRPKFEEYSPKTFVAVDISDSDTAYTLFTSGSTGNPKGVKISFGNLLNLYEGLKRGIYSRFSTTNLNVALVAPFTFDVSIQQIVPSMLLGHTLYITQEDQRKNPNKLFKFIVENRINIFDCTPTHIKMLNSVLMDNSISEHQLKCIIVGGECLKSETIKKFAEKFITTAPSIVNIYGVTECTVDSIYNFFDLKENDYNDLVPIGIPMFGTTALICDEKGRSITKFGQQGELYIGGFGVGLGYLDKTLNSKSFVRLEDFPNELFYKTGDTALINNEGLIVCLGRNDRQVKIRGNRVELADIESCILRFNDFKQKKHLCTRCLLDSMSTSIDAEGICDVCHLYENSIDELNQIFGDLEELNFVLKNSRSKYDVILLYSGGKDSTYALIRLVEMGFRVLAYTFDNGYLSAQALENISIVTKELNVDSVIETFPKMDDVFSESIKSYSTVCDGCFKVLTSLSTKYALEHGIRSIVTGLNRGQIIETKLKKLLEHGISSRTNDFLKERRKIYHYWDNHFSSLVKIPYDSKDIDSINFIDYFFYEDVSEKKILTCLTESGYWKRSSDTGICSTNCRINDVGIAAFIRDKGYHKYAASLSWDIRLGYISRDEGITKLSTSHFDYTQINEMLNHFGTTQIARIEDCHIILKDEKLFAFIHSTNDINISRLQSFVKRELPSYMMPYRFIVIDSFPLTDSGKIDDMTLLSMTMQTTTNNKHKVDDPYIIEITKIWETLLEYSDFGTDDNFFEIGGNSLDAVVMSVEIEKRFKCSIPFNEMGGMFTIKNIANQIKIKKGESL